MPSSHETPPQPALRRKIAFVESSETLEQKARDVADAKLTAEKGSLKGVGGFFSRVIKHNILRDVYRQVYIDRAKKAIKGDGTGNENLYADEGTDRAAHQQTLKGVADRFISEYDTAVHKDAGEIARNLDDRDAVQHGVKETIRDLVRDYATNAIDDAEFAQRRNVLYQAMRDLGLREGKQEIFDKGVLYADNLSEYAQEQREVYREKQRLDALDLDFDVVVAKAKSGVRTEAQFDAVDRLISKVQDKTKGVVPFGLVNETTYAAGIALLYSGVARTAQSLARSKLAAVMTVGSSALASLGIGFVREQRRQEELRRQHFREMAQGKEFRPDQSPVRSEMEQFRYDTRKAADLTQAITSLLEGQNADQLLGALGSAESRVQISDQQKIDLIGYTEEKTVDQERLALDIAIAKAKVKLRALGKTDADITGESSRQRALLTQGDAGIERKNQLFNKMKNNKAIKAAIKGAIIGAVVGEVFHEAGAVVGGARTGVIGPDTPWPDGSHHYTPLGGAVAYLKAFLKGEHMPGHGNGVMHEALNFNDHHVQFKVPEGYGLTHNPDGTYNLVEGNGGHAVASHFKLNPDGTYPPETRQIMQEAGVGIGRVHNRFVITENVQQNESAADYLADHPAGHHAIKRDLWYDNDTPKPVFDQNELRMDWGGQHNTGLTPDGKFIFNVSRMTHGGSFHDVESADAPQLINEGGHLKALLSLSRGTQNEVFAFPVDAHGNVLIDPNSPDGQEVMRAGLFSVDRNGQAIFNGRFAEIAQSMGDRNGFEHVRVLATYEGDGIDNIACTAPETKIIDDVRVGFFPPESDTVIDIPPIIPVIPNMPMEPTYRRERPQEMFPPEVVGYSYNERRKRGYSDLSQYRNSDQQIVGLIEQLDRDPEKRRKYKHVLERLNMFANVRNLPEEQRDKLQQELERYNRRYGVSRSFDEYVAQELGNIFRQIENIYIEEAKVGEKVFVPEFYEKSNLVKGLEQTEEVVVILPDPIGDAVLMTPLLHALSQWMKLNGKEKPIQLVTRHPQLFEVFQEQFPGLVRLVPANTIGQAFQESKRRFIINTHQTFEDYGTLGISPEGAQDPSQVMSVDWASWQREIYPERAGKSVKYDMIPARIARNFEVMTGQRLFENINATESFINRSSKFEAEANELRLKYDVASDAEVIVISPGASVTPKEYSPERWSQVMGLIFQKYPKAHILFLEDPDPTKRELYGVMVDEFKRTTGNKVSRVTEGLERMNTIMSMAHRVITPDTGLGHYAGALGKRTLMLMLSDPVQWSTPGARQINHAKALERYRTGSGVYNPAWNQDSSGSYYTNDNGVLVGASDIDPEVIVDALEERESVKAISPELPAGWNEKIKDLKTFTSLIHHLEELPDGHAFTEEGKHMPADFMKRFLGRVKNKKLTRIESMRFARSIPHKELREQIIKIVEGKDDDKFTRAGTGSERFFVNRTIDDKRRINIQRGKEWILPAGVNLKKARIEVPEGATLTVEGEVSDSAMIRVRAGGKVKIKSMKDSILVAEKGAKVEVETSNDVMIYKHDESEVKIENGRTAEERTASRVSEIPMTDDFTSTDEYKDLEKNRVERIAEFKRTST